MKPNHLAAMTYTPVPGTKMYKEIERGDFHVLNDTDCLKETMSLVEGIHLENLHFTSNHASNYVPIDGYLSRDKEQILKLLNAAINGEVPKRTQFQRGL
jgi:coproporphyrinogen III oxidase-like Fe-S oxidoreductase